MIKAKILLFDKLPASHSCPNNQYIKSHVSEMKNSDYKSASTLAYSLLADMLSEFLGVDVSDIIIKENEYGKPGIVSENNLYFNISHTSGAVCCVISDTPTGIDIEKIGEIREIIIKKCFSPKEIAYINSPEDFYILWTLKESYLKALGTGINRPLTDIEFSDFGDGVCRDSGVVVPLEFYSAIVDGFAFSIASESTFSASDLIVEHI